jgi:hypothetical protein
MKYRGPSKMRVLASSLELLETRIAPAFATVLDLSALVGPNGFQIHGGDSSDYFASSLSDAGDINGDGFADIIVGAFGADANGVDSGASYVIFGKSGGFSADVYLSSLNGTNGFKIVGEAAGDRAGSVSAAGDINHDGFADLVVGASGADANGVDSGAGYVVFGHSGAFPAVLQLSSLTGPTGFKIKGEAAGDGLFSVSAAGDVNGDNIDDLLIGAPSTYPHNINSGASYVVFGHAGTFAGALDLSNLTGANGFKINGEGGFFGAAVSNAGDVNADGYDDIVIGAPYLSVGGDISGVSYVIFGHGGAFPATFNVSSLNGSNGFKLAGRIEDSNSGIHVSNAGDINGDGFADIAIGTVETDNVYVVFGHNGVFPTSIELPSLSGPTGFVIRSGPRDGDAAISVSAAGDVNGDGFDDLLIGDPQALIFNNYDDAVGVSYVVYGHGGAFADTLTLSSLDGTNGLQINGSRSGSVVDGAGDVNGDGFGDVLIAGINTSYVLFGPGFTSIAPKISANGKTATFIDADGDRVTVKTTRGTFDTSNFAIYATPVGVKGGGQFSGLDLSDAEFAGANLTITAKRTSHHGDGLVNLGFLDATGIDLGKVKIEGDLGRLEVGDTDLRTSALRSLDIGSMGSLGVSAQLDIVQGFESHIAGSIPNVKIAGDIGAIHLSVGSLGTVKVGGSIGSSLGDSVGSTDIYVSGDLTALSVGGDIRFSYIYVDGDIGRIAAGNAPGKFHLSGGVAVKGSIVRSAVRSSGDFSSLTVGGNFVTSSITADGDLNPANLLAAQTIGVITVKGRVESSTILVGDNDSRDVQVGTMSVGGDWIASNLFVGALTVNNDGVPAILAGGDPAILASVASIVIKGRAYGTVGGSDQYYFLAEQIRAFKSGGFALPMTFGPDVFNVGPTFDLTVRDSA